MGLSFWHVLVAGLVILIVFGAGKLPNVMGDLGRGLRNFKAGLNADEKTDDKSDKSGKPLPPPDA